MFEAFVIFFFLHIIVFQGLFIIFVFLFDDFFLLLFLLFLFQNFLLFAHVILYIFLTKNYVLFFLLSLCLYTPQNNLSSLVYGNVWVFQNCNYLLLTFLIFQILNVIYFSFFLIP